MIMEMPNIPASLPGFGEIMETPYIPASPPGIVRAGMEAQQPRPVGQGRLGIADALVGAVIINRANAWESQEEKDARPRYSRRAASAAKLGVPGTLHSAGAEPPGTGGGPPLRTIPKNELLKVLGRF